MTTYWGPRAEEPEAIARKFLRSLAALATVNPVFGNWHVGHEEGVPLASLSFDDVVQFIRDGSVDQNDPEDPRPPVHSLGYNFFALNTLAGGPRAVTVSVHAGQSFSTAYYVNTADIEIPALCAENADLITLAVMKPALLALIEIWQPTWCGLRPAAIFDFQVKSVPGRPWFGLTWVTYLSPRFAPLVTPPESVITESLPDGGLLMIATEDRFDVEDPAHMAAARAIEAAMAPVNALPWPPDGEPLPWLIK
jgi:hypothetical protein